MNPLFIKAVDTFVAIYSKDTTVEYGLRAREAKKPLAVIDACLAAEPANFNTLLYFLESATKTDNRNNLLKLYIFRLAELASTTEEMFIAYRFFVSGKTWNAELKQLLRRIIESDPSGENYSRVIELLLARI